MRSHQRVGVRMGRDCGDRRFADHRTAVDHVMTRPAPVIAHHRQE
jgi:hypothetical protein